MGVRGIYVMANGSAGLIIQVIALQLGAQGYAQYSEDPFEMN